MKKTIFTLLMLLIAMPAIAQFTGGSYDGYSMGKAPYASFNGGYGDGYNMGSVSSPYNLIEVPYSNHPVSKLNSNNYCHMQWKYYSDWRSELHKERDHLLSLHKYR